MPKRIERTEGCYSHMKKEVCTFLGSIFLYRNALQGMGYGLVPMLGGIFELVARAGIVFFIAEKQALQCVSGRSGSLDCGVDSADSILYLCYEEIQEDK